jgi:hypothetical protein
LKTSKKKAKLASQSTNLTAPRKNKTIEFKEHMKTRILKFLRNTLISIVALLVLALGGGAAYTWYMGQQELPVATAAAPIEPKNNPVVTPTKPAPDAKMSASVQMITSPVAPGSNASITVKSNAGSNCTIKVIYDKIESKDSGLAAKVADEFGMVSWSWTVEATAPVGKWPVKVTCANAKNSAMVQGDLKIEK